MIPVPSYEDLNTLPHCSSVGGYTLLYVATWKGYYNPTIETLCGDCATKVRDGVAGPWDSDRTESDVLLSLEYGTYDSGPAMACDHCQEEIEASYGDPEDEQA